MRFSLSLPRPEEHASVGDVDRLVAVARDAELIGMDAVSASDHPFPVVAGGRAGHHSLDPFVLLTLIGAATTTVRLHFSLIVAPYRNPFVVARMLSTMDIATRGRLIVALGAGYLREEFDALGADYENRDATTELSASAMVQAWSGEPVTMDGDGWSARGNVMRPAPISSPRPVLWRGGNSRRAIAAAARRYDGWAPFEIGSAGADQTATRASSLELLPAQIRALRDAAAEAGRAERIDVCFVRPGRRWLMDRARAEDELARLQQAGVTWVELTVPGASANEVHDGLAEVRAVARVAGVLETPRDGVWPGDL